MPDPMPDLSAKRAFALDAVKRLREHGFEAVWAGGCVRDQLLGLVPKDYDVATSATPDQIREVFGRRRTLAIGAAFGVIVLLGTKETGQIDVATFRRDVSYSDGRRPDAVAFTDAQEDARRRDFTINGLFYDPLAGQVIDYVGGQEDLRRRVVRAIGKPRERFTEDKLRMLRAVRFAATLADFTIDDETLAAIGEMAAEIRSVSAERIAAEMRRMLVHPRRDAAVEFLAKSRLLDVLMPEFAARLASEVDRAVDLVERWQSLKDKIGADVVDRASIEDCARGVGELPAISASVNRRYYLIRAANLLAALSTPTFPLALAVMLYGLGIAEHAEDVCRRWRLSNDETDRTAWLCANATALEHSAKIPWPKLQRILTNPFAFDLIELHAARAAIGECDPEAILFCRERLGWPPERLNPRPLVTGDDLKRHGIPTGKHYKRLLEALRDAQLEGRVATPEESLRLAERLHQQLAESPDERM